MPYCCCRRLQILLYPSVQLITLCSSLLASLKKMEKDPIIILGSSLNSRKAAHPQCHKCLCYCCKLTNRQRKRDSEKCFARLSLFWQDEGRISITRLCRALCLGDSSRCSQRISLLSPLPQHLPPPPTPSLSWTLASISFPHPLGICHLQILGTWHGVTNSVALIRTRLCPPLPLCKVPPPALPTTHTH